MDDRFIARVCTGAVVAFLKVINNSVSGYIKCKAIPLQTLTGPEGSRRLRLPDFKTIGT
jgi:hypothetical protein